MEGGGVESESDEKKEMIQVSDASLIAGAVSLIKGETVIYNILIF
jgi:hypothetical protein